LKQPGLHLSPGHLLAIKLGSTIGDHGAQLIFIQGLRNGLVRNYATVTEWSLLCSLTVQRKCIRTVF